LTVLSDILITDYSSVCMNFAYLNKPVIFYAFDLDDYNETRSFCFGYEDYVPGTIVKDYKDIPEIIKNPPDSEKIREFGEFNFKYIDNDNTERIIKKVIGNL
ncbi:MAG: CDP-glycerol glycerophosphotransferase family protein, partial [Clostridia bacterium]|nr:CDP-glycerol glycerophosphotransferase family protein [Clostridia bacterium]